MSAMDFPELDSQTQLLGRLIHLLQHSSPFVFLSGEPGSGRTTLSQQLLGAFVSPWKVAFVGGKANETPSRYRERLVSQWYPERVFNPEDSLVDTLTRNANISGANLLLVVDDADKVDVSVLAEVWDFYCINNASPSGARVSVLLCGNPAWCTAQVGQLEGAETPALEVDIDPLTLEEQQALLAFSLNRSGNPKDVPELAKLGEQLRQCAGNPGQIVALAERIMSRNIQVKRPQMPKMPTQKVMATGAVVLAVIVLLSWVVPALRGNHESAKTAQTPQTAQPASGATATVIPAQQSVQPTQDQVKLPDPHNGFSQNVGEQAPAGERRVVIQDQVVNQIMTQQGQVASGAQSVASGAQASVSSSVSNIQQLPPLAQELKNGEVQASGASAAVSATKPAANKPEVTKTVAPATTKVAEKKPAAKAQVKKPVANAPKLKAGQIEPFAATETSAAGKSGGSVVGLKESKSELAKKAASRYSIQLMAGSDAAPLMSFAKQHATGGQAYVYQTTHNGKPWFVLVQGDYATSAQAHAAIQAMSGQLTQAKPWPKSFAQIQKDMK